MDKCGCGGEIQPKVGCITYSGSDAHQDAAMHEDFMRTGGLGFARHYNSFDATMLGHLQLNGATYEEARDIMRGVS